MVTAIKKEINLQKNYLDKEKVETIYFGGGTPSLLSDEELKSIIEQLYLVFDIDQEVEVTLEANPDDLSISKLKELFKSGINRLSIGIQSFDNDILKFLNRAHSSLEAIHCLKNVKNVGFNNISLDLIYGIPGRKENQWLKDLQTAISFNPEHISAYSLTIEPETVFGRWQKKGRFPQTDEDQSAKQFEVMTNFLHTAGYEQYEVSNFCKPGWYSKHNSSYWQQKNYLGIGPSAHSYNGHSRQFNIKKNGLYMKAVMNESVPATVESLSHSDKINEYLLTTLRTKWGVDMDYLQKRYGLKLELEGNSYLRNIIQNGYAIVKGNSLILTDKGKLVADKIASDLFVE